MFCLHQQCRLGISKWSIARIVNKNSTTSNGCIKHISSGNTQTYTTTMENNTNKSAIRRISREIWMIWYQLGTNKTREKTHEHTHNTAILSTTKTISFIHSINTLFRLFHWIWILWNLNPWNAFSEKQPNKTIRKYLHSNFLVFRFSASKRSKSKQKKANGVHCAGCFPVLFVLSLRVKCEISTNIEIFQFFLCPLFICLANLETVHDTKWAWPLRDAR